MRSPKLWDLAPDGRWRSVSCHLPIWVSPSGSTPAFEQGADITATDRVLITQIDPESNICGVVLRPDQSTVALRINGADVTSGLHVLRHGDRVSIDQRELWVSVAASPDHDRYAPGRHGTPAYCARTKAPLRADDPIVVCGGQPARACGLLYTADAWATGIPCHGCGAPVEATEWSPPVAAVDASVDELIRLVHATEQTASEAP